MPYGCSAEGIRKPAGGSVKFWRTGSPGKLAYSSRLNQPIGLYQGFFCHCGFAVCTAVSGTTPGLLTVRLWGFLASTGQSAAAGAPDIVPGGGSSRVRGTTSGERSV